MQITNHQQAVSITKPGRYSAGETLYLRVAPGGSKQWVQRVTLELWGRTDKGLGSFKRLSLADARKVAAENLRQISLGNDPFRDKQEAKLKRMKAEIEAQRKANMPTFEELEREAYQDKLKAGVWKSPVTAKRWRGSFDTYCHPIIGQKRIDAIKKADVLRVLRPIWNDKQDAAKKLRQAMRDVFKLAMVNDYITVDLAGEVIDAALPRQIANTQSHAALPWAEAPAAMRDIQAIQGAAALAMQWLVLTAARRNEVLKAQWNEIDLDAMVWTVPAIRAKTSKDHRVPITPAMVKILDAARALDDGSGHLFPSPMQKGKPLSEQGLKTIMGKIGLKDRASIHGFRSTFRTWAEENGHPFELAEMSLAHAVGNKVERSYQRSDLLDRRRGLMEEWAAFCTG